MRTQLTRRQALLHTAAYLTVPTFYSQSLQTHLASRYPTLHLLVLDILTHKPLANTFPATPIAPGSLLKPFLAATPPMHPFQVTCRGHADRCWKPHGEIRLTAAIAQSCNAFFLAWAALLDPAAIPFLPAPPARPTPADLIGLTSAWHLEPLALAHAYAALLTSALTPAAIRAGMALSATTGTAAQIGLHPGGVLAKTGTAPCVPQSDQPCRVTSDGLVLAAVPAARPTLVLLARKLATTGAATAALANPILTDLKTLHAY